MDGKKYRSDFKSYFHDLRGISNAVSRERGYSVIEPDGKGASYAAWNAEKRGSGTIRDLIRRDIDAALAGSLTYDTFFWKRCGGRAILSSAAQMSSIPPSVHQAGSGSSAWKVLALAIRKQS